MRQLFVQVPAGHGSKVLDIAEQHEAVNSAELDARNKDGALDLVLLHVSNNRVGDLMQDLESIPELHITLIPQGVMALHPPASEAPQQVTNVGHRSPIEIFLGGLQSIGSWKGFLGYAAAAGVVVWIGLFTNTIFLLTAAMLIAPFAAPAMNTALATATGDTVLLRQSILRYVGALLTTIVAAAILSFLLQHEIATDQMVAASTISATAVFLPLVAGAAGALNLVQSERSSLVSGAATGVLVAASLAPPAGLVGMATAIGNWSMAINGIFVLLLQLAGINLSGTIIFRLYGLDPHGVRFKRGSQRITYASLAVTMAALVALLWWQFSSSPNLQRPTQAQRAAVEVQEIVQQSNLAQLVEANVRFTRADIPNQNTLLVVLYVQPTAQQNHPPEYIRERLTASVQERLLAQDFNVTPLVDVVVLEAPGDRALSQNE